MHKLPLFFQDSGNESESSPKLIKEFRSKINWEHFFILLTQELWEPRTFDTISFLSRNSKSRSCLNRVETFNCSKEVKYETKSLRSYLRCREIYREENITIIWRSKNNLGPLRYVRELEQVVQLLQDYKIASFAKETIFRVFMIYTQRNLILIHKVQVIGVDLFDFDFIKTAYTTCSWEKMEVAYLSA